MLVILFYYFITITIIDGNVSIIFTFLFLYFIFWPGSPKYAWRPTLPICFLPFDLLSSGINMFFCKVRSPHFSVLQAYVSRVAAVPSPLCCPQMYHSRPLFPGPGCPCWQKDVVHLCYVPTHLQDGSAGGLPYVVNIWPMKGEYWIRSISSLISLY